MRWFHCDSSVPLILSAYRKLVDSHAVTWDSNTVGNKKSKVQNTTDILRFENISNAKLGQKDASISKQRIYFFSRFRCKSVSVFNYWGFGTHLGQVVNYKKSGVTYLGDKNLGPFEI